MNKISIEEKLKSIENNRNEAIKLVRSSLINRCNLTMVQIDKMIAKVDADSKVYQSLLKVKELMFSLIDEVVFASTADDIIKVRTTLNYYLTKVRKEVEKRSINKKIERQYFTSLLYVRDDVKEYIRCLKRKDNMDSIINDYHDDLSKEEKKDLNYNISKERKFNTRIKEKYTNPRVLKLKQDKAEEVIEDKKKEISLSTPKKDVISTKESVTPVVETKVEEKITEKPVVMVEEPKVEEIATQEPITSVVEPVNEEKIYINSNMLRMSTNYVITPIRKYDGNLATNIGRLFANIPGYIHNKRIINLMKMDYANYYSGKDLRELIEVSDDNNSIVKALEAILNNTKLGKKLNKNIEEYEAKQKNANLLLDIIEEYKAKQECETVTSDFSYDSLESSKMKVLESPVPVGNINFAKLR